MSMPFGTIFAIFLIVAFIIFAFMAVRGFLDIGTQANAGMFYNELEEAVDDAMKSQISEDDFTIRAPKGITHVCFANLSAPVNNRGAEYEMIRNFEVYEANTFLIPPQEAGGMEWRMIDNIDIEKTTSQRNPYCVSVNQDLVILKEFMDRKVTIQ